MKRISHLACSVLLAFSVFATSAATPNQELSKKVISNIEKFDGVFVVKVREGVVKVVNDRVDIPIIPFDVSPPINMESLKEAWKNCYGAMMLSQKDTLDTYFVKGVPPVLRKVDQRDGQVIFIMTSRVNNTVRLILKFETLESINQSSAIYDAHTWRMNDNGKWVVESTIYQ